MAHLFLEPIDWRALRKHEGRLCPSMICSSLCFCKLSATSTLFSAPSDTLEILKEAGYSAAEIERLIQSGAAAAKEGRRGN